jgi:aminoglycoside phosphotransferase (APT) family kinase protein
MDRTTPQALFTGTQAVSPAHRFNEANLDAWMRDHVPDYHGPIAVTQFKGGQSNPTFLLKTADRRYVLRRKPVGELLPSAHAVDREFRVLQALAGTQIPVAQTHTLCEDTSVIGSSFYVMDHVEGRIFWDPALPDMTPAERAVIFDELNRVIGALHSVQPTDIGLADYGRPGAYLERQITRWTRQYQAAQTEPIEAANRLMEWLPRHMPSEGSTRLVHGDYRIDNVIFHPTEPRIVAVLDWELSTLGDPLVDFSYHCMAWRMSPQGSRGLLGLDLASLGIPSESEYLNTYMNRTGCTQDLPPHVWNYYMVFNLFRLASILQGVAKRALLGNASNANATDAGKRARPLAEQAWALAQSIPRAQ